MSTIINIILLVVLAVAAYFIYTEMTRKKSPNTATPDAKDTLSQGDYEAKKHPKDEEVSLTMEERVELSWNFLTNITEQILNKFTKTDREKVHDAGAKMNKHGMSYQHDVSQEAQKTIGIVKSRTREQNQSKGRSR